MRDGAYNHANNNQGRRGAEAKHHVNQNMSAVSVKAAIVVLRSFSNRLLVVADGATASSYARVLRPQSVFPSRRSPRLGRAIELSRLSDVTQGLLGSELATYRPPCWMLQAGSLAGFVPGFAGCCVYGLSAVTPDAHAQLIAL